MVDVTGRARCSSSILDAPFSSIFDGWYFSQKWEARYGKIKC